MNNSTNKIIFINQSTGTLFVDVVNAFGNDNVLFTGISNINKDYLKELSNIKIEQIIAYNKTNIVTRICTWLIASIQIWIKVILKYKNSHLFIVSNPPFTTFLPLFLKNNYSFLIYDIYPDILIGTHIIKENGIISKCWKKANIRLFNRAKNIYTIGNSMAGCLTQYVGKSKVVVIHNWANNNSFEPVTKKDNKFALEYGLQDKFVVMYSGNMGNTHSIEPIIDVAEYLESEKDIVFVLIGDGNKREKIKKMIYDKQLNNCLLLPYQPVTVLPYSLGCADVGIVTLSRDTSKYSVPSKTYNLMSAGCVLLCIGEKESELSNIIFRYEVGKIFSDCQVLEMVDFLKALKNDVDLLKTYKIKALKTAKNFTPANAKLYMENFKY